ncbi:CgeB family protein [Neptunomonas japonica]|uniref:Spore coat protein n=1 Tax=Neptunomonas japonica JAMM 1380 TaxID=1441457 RepID=A0A7R6SW37_9GAMM|nr:glycosyltransferase [Neptunomonas japonica]BBB30254.1 spore coat protein [Neptunomonas japonica JAMM 1380]
MRVAIISDELTFSCLDKSVDLQVITQFNYRLLLRFVRPDFLIVESAWSGLRNKWKFKVAAYPDHPNRNNRALLRVVDYAKDLGIPTVFWNKEDGVHFERFIDSAKHFDHIFTVDETCISRYREVVPESTTVNTLMFPVQTCFHSFEGFNFKTNRANFTGSYSNHIHGERRRRQDFLLKAASDVIGLTVYDRNSDRKSSNYRYPDFGDMEIRSSVPHDKTAQIYRDHLVSLNVNTVVDSPTMYSRRLIEIIGCGGIAVTTPAQSVDKYFQEYCYVVDSYEEAFELFTKLSHGPSAGDLERSRAGAEYVKQNHTWEHRLNDIARVLGI